MIKLLNSGNPVSCYCGEKDCSSLIGLTRNQIKEAVMRNDEVMATSKDKSEICAIVSEALIEEKPG